MKTLRKQRFERWFWAGLCVTVIYATLGIVRPICEFLKQNTPLTFIMNTGLALFLVGMLVVLRRFGKVISQRNFYGFYLVVVMYGGAFYLVDVPEEKIHFVEYGLLAFLIYRALILDWKERYAFLGAFVMASLVGWGDEGIQLLLPNRYYQFKDVVLNSIGAGLGLFLTFIIRTKK